MQSPLAELSASNVTLKSLRPKGSMVNMNYSLPLRANFGMISKYIRERIVTEYWNFFFLHLYCYEFVLFLL